MVSKIDKLMIDTCVLRDWSFVYWLSGHSRGKLCISAITYAEQMRQLLANNKSVEKFNELLDRCHITVVPFTKQSADTAARLMAESPKVCEMCQNFNWADTMIYSTLGNPPALLVTNSVKDYPNENRVFTPEEIRNLLK